MSKNETLNVGIIGAGHMGARHADRWARMPGCRVAAVCGIADVQAEKAERLAAQAGNDATAYRSADELLAAPDIDAVSVCVPTYLHRQVVEAAAAAGKHVLCEKPMALTLDDCDAMTAAMRAAGKVFAVGQVVRFFPEYANAKQLIDAGRIGKPAAVRTRRGGDCPRSDTDWFVDPAKSGGVLLDLLVHDFDWLQWCFGPVERVYARALTPRLADKSLDHLDYALVTLRHRSGVIAHMEGTWADPAGFATAFDIAGDAGLLTHDSRRAQPLTVARREREGAPGGVAVPASPLAPEDDPYFLQIAAFAKSVLDGAPPAVTPEEARAAVAVALAALESVHTGEAVTL
jgi:predicted dehydrogenase